ncbi:MAG: PIG-L family deacetylase [Spirochaetia bacterium]|jgi:bacillithiol biosynthesis deacetylase BshB1
MADILVFGAHPDDAEFGMGASMVKFVRSGATVAVCVLTRGEAGTFGTPQEREAEMKAAAAKLGSALDILSFRDCQVFDSYEARVQLAQVIRKHRPRIIFAPYHTNPSFHKDGAAHPDHTAVGTIVRSATRYARFAGLKDAKGEPWNAEHILYYMVPRSRTPSLLNDVTAYMAEWESIARCHTSQLNLRDGKVLESLRRFREGYGNMLGVAYAEGFIVEEPLLFDLSLFLGASAQPGGVPRDGDAIGN